MLVPGAKVEEHDRVLAKSVLDIPTYQQPERLAEVFATCRLLVYRNLGRQFRDFARRMNLEPDGVALFELVAATIEEMGGVPCDPA